MSNLIVVDYHIKSRKFVIICPFGMNEHIREIPTRAWGKSKVAWVAPLIKENVFYLDNVERNTELWTDTDSSVAAM